MRRLLLVTAALSLLCPVPSEAQNCTGQYYPNNSGSLITFTAGSGVLDSQVQAAINEWTGCAQAGFGFPDLSMSGSGVFNIDVVLEPGVSTTNGGGCGVFEHELGNNGEVIGGTIVLFDANVLGGDCEPYRSDTIAHEIGHVLGLSDVSMVDCPGYMMSGSQQRSVQSDECKAASDYWTTTEENPPPPPHDPEDPPLCDTSPILLDLDSDGFHLVGAEEGVTFDIDADGRPERISWTSAGAGDAFLTLDRDQNGRINDASELFGTATRLSDGSLAPNGFVALAAFDLRANGGNGDGQISAVDSVWPKLGLWSDRDHDGETDAGELLLVSSSGIESLDLQYVESRSRDAFGNQFRYRSKARRSGARPARTIQVVDVFFVLMRPEI